MWKVGSKFFANSFKILLMKGHWRPMNFYNKVLSCHKTALQILHVVPAKSFWENTNPMNNITIKNPVF